jgi:hypothetical protein
MTAINQYRIFIGEAESNSQNDQHDATRPMTTSQSSPQAFEAKSEVLLPPLPEEDDVSLARPSLTLAASAPMNGDVNDSRSASCSRTSTPHLDQKPKFDANYYDDPLRSSDYSDILLSSCLSSYESHAIGGTDNAAIGGLALDKVPFHIFPSMAAPTNKDAKPTDGDSQQSTSPIKRLKSLKNGIRKLSLSSQANKASLSTTHPPATPNRPMLSPLQTTLSNSSAATNRFSQDSSTNSDLMLLTDNVSNMNLSYDKMSQYAISLSKRSRALSGSALTPITPPFSSPVITLSDNLLNSKKSLLNIEHSYFDSLNLAKANAQGGHNDGNGVGNATTDSSLSCNHFDHEDDQFSSVHSISELSTPSELIDYFMFVKEQKKTVIEAFETTRERLQTSGWCSEHDLNNLQLQQESSLCQLDTKLIQLKDRMDTEFNMSFFSDETKESGHATQVTPKANQMSSPSLKVLENRCFSFSEFRC